MINIYLLGLFMGLIIVFILIVWAVVNFVGLCSVVISLIHCRTVPGYRNIAIIGAVFIPVILLFLTFLDVSTNKPAPSPTSDIQLMANIVWSRTFLICFLGACVTTVIAFWKTNAIRRYSALGWGFLISSLSASAFVFIRF
ncbi:MAG: hypothetical protein KME23_03450 [Goleter apudmare HA4340-LM2]|nr:hypothetical protein [Goleter apudmare HA4340-LM2]